MSGHSMTLMLSGSVEACTQTLFSFDAVMETLVDAVKRSWEGAIVRNDCSDWNWKEEKSTNLSEKKG